MTREIAGLRKQGRYKSSTKVRGQLVEARVSIGFGPRQIFELDRSFNT